MPAATLGLGRARNPEDAAPLFILALMIDLSCPSCTKNISKSLKNSSNNKKQ